MHNPKDTDPTTRADNDLLDDACQQWEESGLGDKLGPAFLLLGRLVQRRLEHALSRAGLGLTPAQARVIVMLHFHGPLSQQSLAAHTDVEPSTLVSTLDVMEREEYARRERNPNDRRAYLVHLTERGARLVPRLFALWDEVEERLLAPLDDEELSRLHHSISRLISNLSEGETCCG